LRWTIDERDEHHIDAATARCTVCGADYPVRDGIGRFLTPDLPREDYWKGAESRLSQMLRDDPKLERVLLETPLFELNPADRFIRAMALESRGAFREARAAQDSARVGIYTPETVACSESQFAYIVDHLDESNEPVVDLASGRGSLVERMVDGDRLIVVTDFSPSVLRRDRHWFEAFGMDGNLDFLAFDARRTPFADRSVTRMTSYVGIPSIKEPGRLLDELRRVIEGEFLSIMILYPEDDEANREAIRELGVEPFHYRESTLEAFARAGFDVSLENVREGRALPTPKSALINGAGIDGLPVAETVLTWATLVAR
jgi:hypothetical protein